MAQNLITRRTVLQAAATTATCRSIHARRLRRRQAVLRHLGPLGSRCQRSPEQAVREWAEKEKVELTFDLITSNGDKDLLTLMAEGQAKSGHDVMGLRTWYVAAQADNFVPVDAWSIR